MDLKEEAVLGRSVGQHWYYQSKAAALLRIAAPLKVRRILDVGAGSGFFSRNLLANTKAQEAKCIDPNYIEERDELLDGKVMKFRRKCDVTDADLLLMMDVLEHVKDDFSLLDEYIKKIPTGAYLIVTVPAFRFLWSSHDEFLGHFRRYTLKQTVDLLENAGLEIEQKCYFFGLVFPLAVLRRLFGKISFKSGNVPQSDLKQHSTFANGLLRLLCWLELPLFRFNRLAGLSVFCLARKRSESVS